MYSKFSLTLNAIKGLKDSFERNPKYLELGNKLFEDNLKNFKKDYFELFFNDFFLNKKQPIDVEQLEKLSFPNINADIFLSHSSNDIDFIKAFSGFLKINFDLNSFIDSAVWNNVYSILKKIDKIYALKDDGYYSYEIRNHTTKNIYTILAVALIKMIDKLESIFFIQTPNSVNMADEKIGSSWIYIELISSSLLQKKNISNYRKEVKLEASLESNVHIPKFKFPFQKNHLIELNYDDLENWINSRCFNNTYSIHDNISYDKSRLDDLYELVKDRNNN